MRLSLESPGFRHLPQGVCERGRVKIDGQWLEAGFLLAADVLLTGWGPARIEELGIDHLLPIFERQPELVLLGTGPRLVFPPPPLLAAALVRGIGIEVMDNAAAARTYTVLAGEGRKVLAAFVVPSA